MPCWNTASRIDMREVIARVVDGSCWMDFKPDYGAGHRCAAMRRI